MEESLSGITFGFVLSGLLLGLAIGFVLQRGRFCMNTAFRDTIFIQDFTLFRGYLIALAIMILGSNILNDMEIVSLKAQPFWPLANIIGGYVFGLGIVMVGGCGSGVWYKIGEGQFNAIIAVLGFFLGIHMTATGILRPAYNLLRSYKIMKPVTLPDGEETNVSYTLWNIFGDGMNIKWIVIAAVVIALLVYILKGKPFSAPKQKGLEWPKVGVLLGLLGVASFWLATVFEGFPRGLSFTTPTGEFFSTLLTGNAMLPSHPLARVFPMYQVGPFTVTWASFFIIGIPLGAFISAKILNEFKWKIPPVDEMLSVCVGSLMMGFGAMVAGGCNIGQGLTGASTLSIGSLVAIIFIILGNWTMVYFKFIKPMQD
ncbi:MAG: YeeE/YedE family protein [Nitrospirae bacterium]|nr:YeeE/YedE family protein [Nitrospirota bacterium]